jgi:pescadillo protein
MVKKLKKGKKGAQANFVTRSKAIRKLQLKLSDFRKLCILKGIYPREPKKAPKGKDKVYYHLKDIKFLAHEKLLDKFRELRAFSKKIKRSLGRGDKSRVKELKENKPRISLNHLVKERYPTFVDAIRDLDDALCLLSLYSVLASHKLFMVNKELIEGSSRLMREFSLYIIKS